MDLNNLQNFLDVHTIKSIPLTIFTDFIGEKKCNQLKKLTRKDLAGGIMNPTKIL